MWTRAALCPTIDRGLMGNRRRKAARSHLRTARYKSIHPKSDTQEVIIKQKKKTQHVKLKLIACQRGKVNSRRMMNCHKTITDSHLNMSKFHNMFTSSYYSHQGGYVVCAVCFSRIKNYRPDFHETL